MKSIPALHWYSVTFYLKPDSFYLKVNPHVNPVTNVSIHCIRGQAKRIASELTGLAHWSYKITVNGR
jgi:hypothetical protein